MSCRSDRRVVSSVCSVRGYSQPVDMILFNSVQFCLCPRRSDSAVVGRNSKPAERTVLGYAAISLSRS